MRFETGQEVPQDFREAIRFYRIAADLGHIKAQEKIELAIKRMITNFTTKSARKNSFHKEKSELPPKPTT